MQTDTYDIPTEKLPEFVKRFERIQRKAEKLGGLVGYKVGETKEVKQSFTGPDGETWFDIFSAVEVTVWGEAPVIEGWEVIAVIDHSTMFAGSPFNIVHVFGDREVSDKFRTSGNDCEHCGWDRNRKKTVILNEVATGARKQVGLGCLGDFTGSHDPHHAARLCEYLEQAFNVGGGFSFSEPLLDKVEYLRLVAASIRVNGWVSRGRALRHEEPTADAALSLYRHIREARGRIGTEYERPGDREFIAAKHFTPEDEAKTEAALEWLEFEADTSTLPTMASPTVKTDDFLSKLYAALAGDGLVLKHRGIAAALFVAYDKANEGRVVKAAEATSVHVGVEGERDEFVVTVTAKRNFEGGARFSYYDDGVRVLVSMVDDAGNIIKWWTNLGTKAERALEPQKRYRIAGTVKDHGEYKGTNETTLTRVSIKEVL